MPERRKRMLTVEESPVISVPVVASETWMKEPEPRSESDPVRFQSEDEGEEEETAEADTEFFFSASTPSVSTSVSVAASPVRTIAEALIDQEPEWKATPPATRPQFAELEEEPTYSPIARDFALDFDPTLQAAVNDHRTQPAAALFPEPDEESLRELDTPTFMRRLQF
jgi:cell division protein FtsZ